mgnify:CR=1 FL=1
MTEENKDINNLSDLSKLNQTEESSSIEREPKIDKFHSRIVKESIWIMLKIHENTYEMPLF